MTDQADDQPDVPLGRQSAADKRAAETVALNRDQVKEMMAQANAAPAEAAPPAPPAAADSESTGLDKNVIIAIAVGAVVVFLILAVALG